MFQVVIYIFLAFFLRSYTKLSIFALSNDGSRAERLFS